MGSYSDIKSKASSKYKVKGGSARKAYANGGAVGSKGGTNVTIVVPPAAPAGGPPVPPPGPMPSGPAGGPPGPGPAAMQAMGAGGPPPGAFKAGGRVKGGAAGGEGRLDKIPGAKAKNKTNMRRGGKAKC